METYPDGPAQRPARRRVSLVLVVAVAAMVSVLVGRDVSSAPSSVTRTAVAAVASFRPPASPPGGNLDLPARPDESAGVPATTTTTTTAPATTAPATETPAAAPGAPAAASVPATGPAPAGYGCADALAYLRAHAAPGFSFECPGNALGHQAMTCAFVAGVCPGTRVIAIADPCPAAYMNEAYNSRVTEGLARGPFDPYGYCRN